MIIIILLIFIMKKTINDDYTPIQPLSIDKMQIKDHGLYIKPIELKNANQITFSDINKEKLLDAINNTKYYDNVRANLETTNINNKELFEDKIYGGASLLDDDLGPSIRNAYDRYVNTLKQYSVYEDESIYNEYLDDSLRNFIHNNNRQINKVIQIPNDYQNYKKYSFFNRVKLNINERFHTNHFNKNINCHEYNKKVVTSFEENFIADDNINSINNLIRKHSKYIADLSERQRCVIYDYTHPNGYNFYSKYYKSGSANWLDMYIRDENERFMFGDAFIHQIIDLCQICRITTAAFEIGQRNDNFATTKFINLPQNAWNYILRKFELELDDIIAKAPTSENNIHCYRGCTYHVLENQLATDQPISLNCYRTSKVTSFSIDFQASKRFCIDNSSRTLSPTHCLYRAQIIAGTPILFIESLTTCDTEFEFITQSDTCIIYKDGFKFMNSVEGEQFPNVAQLESGKYSKYNNINKRIGIFNENPNNKISSIDIIVIKPPDAPPDAPPSTSIFEPRVRQLPLPPNLRFITDDIKQILTDAISY